MNFDNIPKTGGNEYTFASESIDSYIGDYDSDVQDTGAEDLPVSDLLDEPTPEPEPDPTVSQRSAAATAELLTAAIDQMIPMCIGIFAKDTNIAQFKASPDERKELKRAFTEYTKVKGIDLPPGWALVICIAFIYGTKVPTAMMLRKEKEKADTQESTERKEHATTGETTNDGADR